MSLGSRPSSWAISATNDWIAQACATLLTERNQPTRTCICALPLSRRTLGTLNGVSTNPMPCSIAPGYFGSGTKFAMKLGAALRCRQAMTLLSLSRPASRQLRCHGVVEAVLDIVFARPHDFDRCAVHGFGQQRRFDSEVPFRLTAETAAERHLVQDHVFRVDAETLGDIIAGAARALG